MSVIEIVEKYLRDNNYDGLYNSDRECSCETGALEPCGNISRLVFRQQQ